MTTFWPLIDSSMTAVEPAQVSLQLPEPPARVAGDELGEGEHERDDQERGQGEPAVEDEHSDQYPGQGKDARQKRGDVLRDGLS